MSPDADIYKLSPIRARRMDIAAMFWVIKGGGRTILFDAGFYRDQFMNQWRPADYEKPSAAISRLSLKPEDITDWSSATSTGITPTASTYFPKPRSGFRKRSLSITELKRGRGTREPRPIRRFS